VGSGTKGKNHHGGEEMKAHPTGLYQAKTDYKEKGQREGQRAEESNLGVGVRDLEEINISRGGTSNTYSTSRGQ